MYVAILSAMRRADRVFPHHLACAISADCVKAIIHIYPNEDLLEEAACIIDRMVNSRDSNLKYLGLMCMADMIQVWYGQRDMKNRTILSMLSDFRWLY